MKIMENKTAVQWLIDEINEKHFFLFSKLGEQALKIEKEQICNAATWGGLHESAEQYYIETYGNQKESMGI
jgi:hypothetical protein